MLIFQCERSEISVVFTVIICLHFCFNRSVLKESIDILRYQKLTYDQKETLPNLLNSRVLDKGAENSKQQNLA